MPPYRRYSVTMEILLFPFLFARKFSHALQAWALVLPLCRGKEENGFWVVCTFDFLSVASGCCFPFAFLLENNLRKLCTPPKYFQKLIFSIKTLEIGKCLQLRQNTLVLNTRPIVLLKFRWIFNLKGLSPRHWPLSCDAAFPHSALSVGGGGKFASWGKIFSNLERAVVRSKLPRRSSMHGYFVSTLKNTKAD